jgi:hypothetical protein
LPINEANQVLGWSSARSTMNQAQYQRWQRTGRQPQDFDQRWAAQLVREFMFNTVTWRF